MRVLIAANAPLPPRSILAPWLRWAERVVAADGGANRLLAVGVKPVAVVGDLDSVTGATRKAVGEGKVHQDLDPDHTDLEKALAHARRLGATDITIVGATGGRLDHTLGCVPILLEATRRMPVRLVDRDFVTEIVRGERSFEAPVGTQVSLFAPTLAEGVTTAGLRWPLSKATLKPGALGIHNQVVSSPVSLRVERGELVLMRSHGKRPHA